MLELLFGKKKTPAELLREQKRMLDKSIRELDRERMSIEQQEKRIVIDIKKMAKEGQMASVKVMAKSLIRNRHAVTKLYSLKSQLQAISLRVQTLKSTQAMADAMCGASKAMRVMNAKLNLPNLQKIMVEFERQNEKMEMTSEMMGDAVDDALGEAGEEEETEELVSQVLDEIGIGTNLQLVSAPAAKAGAQQVSAPAQPVAMAAGAEGGIEPAGGAGAGIDDDLQARLNALRKT